MKTKFVTTLSMLVCSLGYAQEKLGSTTNVIANRAQAPIFVHEQKG